MQSGAMPLALRMPMGNLACAWAIALIYKELYDALRVRVVPCTFVRDAMSPLVVHMRMNPA